MYAPAKAATNFACKRQKNTSANIVATGSERKSKVRFKTGRREDQWDEKTFSRAAQPRH